MAMRYSAAKNREYHLRSDTKKLLERTVSDRGLFDNLVQELKESDLPRLEFLNRSLKSVDKRVHAANEGSPEETMAMNEFEDLITAMDTSEEQFEKNQYNEYQNKVEALTGQSQAALIAYYNNHGATAANILALDIFGV